MTFLVRCVAAIVLAVAPGLAHAQEGSGCDGFKWPLERERAALTRADKPSLPNGGALSFDAPVTLKLEPFSSAGLPKAPERAPKSPSDFAGHFSLPAPAKSGVYRLTINLGGWVDVLDGGAYLHPIAFSGATGCDGARKSVKFDLPARPLAIQFSGVKADQISVILTPDR